MLWNVVFEFFVKYIFGGVIYQSGSSSAYDSYGGILGRGFLYNNGSYEPFSTSRLFAKITFGASGDAILPLGNYFSLIATIITMVAILLLCVFFIRKIISIVFRLFTGGSSF